MTQDSAGAVFRCEAAWIGGAVRRDVQIRAVGGLIESLSEAGAPIAAGDTLEDLPGLVVPGFADAHSHAFHRALRGLTHNSGGTFWTWRDLMYSLADRLTPDTLRDLAFATYVELLCAGYTSVGEFHYLHHQPGGRRYADPNAMGLAVADAAQQAGIDLTLLDVAYLAGGFDAPLSAVQQRFSDGTVQAWRERVEELRRVPRLGLRVGVAAHSVRAVPARDLPVVAEAAMGGPLHAHLSEQHAENQAALTATGLTPTQLLAEAGALGPATALVHATHLTRDDIDVIGRNRCFAVICPTTEADLADGLGPVASLSLAGARLTLGGDQHVIVDPFAQARGLEYGERLSSGQRGVFSPARLLDVATRESHAAIGSPGGRLEVGAPADLVAIRTDSARTAGADHGQLVMCASAADVHAVVVGGVVRARSGNHVTYGDPGPLLAGAIARAWR